MHFRTALGGPGELAAVSSVVTPTTVALAARRLAPGGANELPVTVVLDTRRADLYVQRFGVDLVPLSAPSTALPEAVVVELPEKGVLLAGDAVPRILALLRHLHLNQIYLKMLH